MTIPFSRNTNYAPGSQVKSDDLNAIQDELRLHKRLMSYTRLWDTDFLGATADPIGMGVLDWRFHAGGDGSPNLVPTIPLGTNFHALRIDAVDTTGDFARVFRKWPLWYAPDNAVSVLEFIVQVTIPTSARFYFGLAGDPFSLTDANALDDTYHDYIWVAREQGVGAAPNWFAHCGNTEQAASASQDLGVAIPDQQWQKIQIRHFGRNHADGGTNGKIEIWIDGVLLHTFDDASASGFPQPDTSSIDAAATGAFSPTVLVHATNANTGDVWIGPVRAWWYALPADAGI